MRRVLDLQKLALTLASDGAAAGSSSSWIGCDCSTNSNSACTPPDEFVAV